MCYIFNIYIILSFLTFSSRKLRTLSLAPSFIQNKIQKFSSNSNNSISEPTKHESRAPLENKVKYVACLSTYKKEFMSNEYMERDGKK